MASHPDRQALDDWAIYGPGNPRIAELVRRLALQHGLHVASIESHIEAGLREWLQRLEAAGKGIHPPHFGASGAPFTRRILLHSPVTE